VEVGKDDEEAENHVHEIVKNNGQNVEYNSITGCEMWVSKENINVKFWSRNLSDGT